MRRRGTIRSGGRSIPVTWLDPVADSPIEIALGGLLLAGLGLLGLVWGAAFFSSWLVNGEAADLSVGDAAVAIARMGSNRLSWSGTWSPQLEESLAGPGWFWTVFAVEVFLVALVFWPAWRLLGPRVGDPMAVVVAPGTPTHPRAARRQAQQEAKEERRVMRASTTEMVAEPPPSAPGVDKILIGRPDGSRLVLGRVGKQLLATDKHHSVLALGPTQSGKTSGLALPAILEWNGPVMVTAAKSDLVSLAWEERAKGEGQTWLFDPTSSMASGPGVPRLPAGGHGWSPLQLLDSVPRPRTEPELIRRVRQWGLARRSAQWMVAGVRSASSSGDLAGPLFGTAEQMLAPLLLAAAAEELPFGRVSEWIDRREEAEVSLVLDRIGVREALAAWEGAHRYDDATTAGSYQVLTSVLYPFGDPMVMAQARDPQISARGLLDGKANTLFILSPPNQQERLRPLFTALISEVIDTAMSQATASPSGRLEEPLLVVLDDAATCAPVELLDQLAAVGAGLGIQLLTLFQDLGQVSQIYGSSRAVSLANNHRARVILPGITDTATLDYLNSMIRGSRLIEPGANRLDDELQFENDAIVSQTASWMRTLEDGAAILVYGNLAPIRMQLRPWFADDALHGRLHPEISKQRRAWSSSWLRRSKKDKARVERRFPNPFDTEANDAEADRYWESVIETGFLPEPMEFDDSSGD